MKTRTILHAACGAALALGVAPGAAEGQQGLVTPHAYSYQSSGADVGYTPVAVAEEIDLVSCCCDSAEPGCGCPECGDPCGAGCCDACGDGACGDAVGCCCSACAAKKKAAKPNPCATSHKGLFYANDFSYLKDPCYRGNCLGDCLKLMPVGPCGKYGTLDIGGQIRLRYHHEEGMGRSSATAPANRGFLNTENDFLLSRFRLYGNWKANDYIRIFVEGILADAAANDTYNPRPIDENYGDLLNAFVDVKMTDEFTLRIGRQELLYGAQRTVSPLDWANTRRTFEGIRGLYKSGDWTADAFYTNFVPVNNDQFDEADYDRSFYGLYSTYSGFENATCDFYYLGFDNQTVGMPIASDFSIHTFGSRVNGKAFGKWLYDIEGAYQGGRQSGLGQDHDAGFVTAGLGRKLVNMKWDPTVWFYFDYASGNHPGGNFNRYNQLFPLAHKYLGFIDAVARSNVVSPNVLVTMKPHQKWNLLFWYYYFGADTASDVIPGVAVPSAQTLTDTTFGSELDMVAKYTISPRSNILFGYSHLWRGAKIIGTDDADFFYSQWTLNF